MSALLGLTPAADYTTGTNKQRVARLRDLLPNPDVPPAAQTVPRFLDQMSPAAVAQLRVDLTALEAAVVNV